MKRVLITAFEPYDRWSINSSWQALMELTRELPTEPKLTTRLYPVDFAEVRKRLANDLAQNYDFVLHLGQAPGLGRLHLESIALNIGGQSNQLPDEFQPLTNDGPVAYRTALPLADWAGKLRECGIPSQVSYHAGTFLCNAVFYLSQHLCQQRGLRTQALFVHIPLAPSQVMTERNDIASLSSHVAAAGLQLILQEMIHHDQST